MTEAIPSSSTRAELSGSVSRSDLSERDAPEVLHGPEGEVGDRHQVELVARVGLVEVLGEEPKRVGAGLERGRGQTGLARQCG